jgi:hypothetical protein
VPPKNYSTLLNKAAQKRPRSDNLPALASPDGPESILLSWNYKLVTGEKKFIREKGD